MSKIEKGVEILRTATIVISLLAMLSYVPIIIAFFGK